MGKGKKKKQEVYLGKPKKPFESEIWFQEESNWLNVRPTKKSEATPKPTDEVIKGDNKCILKMVARAIEKKRQFLRKLCEYIYSRDLMVLKNEQPPIDNINDGILFLIETAIRQHPTDMHLMDIIIDHISDYKVTLKKKKEREKQTKKTSMTLSTYDIISIYTEKN